MKAESMYKAEKDRLHNFSRDENEALTKTGPGTLMGNLFRQYWIPVTPAADLQEPGGRQMRVQLLGEDLVLFRARNGKVGLIGAYCSHRLGPLFFGRVEDDGLRCPYHGWKFAPEGKCMEMPNIPAEQQFTDEIHHPGYPCLEHGGIIWTYMGAAKEQPLLPDLEFFRVSDEDRNYRLFFQECNYLQVMAGGIDPTHVMWLHSPYDLSDEEIARQQPAQQQVANTSGARIRWMSRWRIPRRAFPTARNAPREKVKVCGASTSLLCPSTPCRPAATRSRRGHIFWWMTKAA